MSMMIACNGCGRRIADDDPLAVRNIALPTGADKLQRQTERADWCGSCVAIIRTELPRLAAQAREAQRAAATEPVRSRALNIWSGTPRGIEGPGKFVSRT